MATLTEIILDLEDVEREITRLTLQVKRQTLPWTNGEHFKEQAIKLLGTARMAVEEAQTYLKP